MPQRTINQDNKLITETFGGLNVESARLDLPDGDSPDMLNVDITNIGTVKTRKGTATRLASSVSNGSSSILYDPRGALCAPVATSQGHIILVNKITTGISVVFLPSRQDLGISNRTLSFSGVFSSEAAQVRGSYATSSFFNMTRIIFCTGVNLPVELFIWEKQVKVSSPVSSIVVPDDIGLTNPILGASTNAVSNLFLPNDCSDPQNWTFYEANTISIAGTNVTYSSNFRPGTTNVYANLPAATYTLVRVGWQYWIPAQTIQQKMWYQGGRRFNTSLEDDANVLINPELTRNLEYESRIIGCAGVMRQVFAESENIAVPATTFTKTNPPTTNAQYINSTGQYRNAAVADIVTVGNDWLTWGGIVGAGAAKATPIHIHRQYYNFLKTNGTNTSCLHNAFASPTTTLTQWSGTAKTDFSATPKYSTYTYTSGLTNTNLFIATPATTITIFGVMASYPIGIPSGSLTFLDNTDYTATTPALIGTGGTSVVDGSTRTNNGSKIPVSGLYEFCDVANADFGDVVTTFQGRLAIAGFVRRPSLVVISNQANNYEFNTGLSPLQINRNFQTWYEDPLLGYNPLQISLSIANGESIVAMQATNTNLVVFTNNSVWVISPVIGGTLVTPTNYQITKVASIGALNSSCVTQTDKGIVFLSQRGVYILSFTDNQGTFAMSCLSDKIQRIITAGLLTNGPIAWLTYDAATTKLFIALTEGRGSFVNTRLMVLNTTVGAWTEYGSYSGKWYGTTGAAINGRVFLNYVGLGNISTGALTAVDDYNTYLEFVDVVDFDFARFATALPATVDAPSGEDRIPYYTNQTNYNLAKPQTNLKTIGHKYVPSNQVVDLKVLLGKVADPAYKSATLNDYFDFVASGGATPIDFQKTPQGGIVISDDYVPPASVDQIIFTSYNLPNGGGRYSPFIIYVDNVEKRDLTNYTVSQTQRDRITFTDINCGIITSCKFGVCYAKWYVTAPSSDDAPNSEKKYTSVTLHIRNGENKQFNIEDVAPGQQANLLVDEYRDKVDISFSLLFDGSQDQSYDVFSLYGDTTRPTYNYGKNIPKSRREPESRLRWSVQGVGQSASICVFTLRDETWELVGTEIASRGKTSISARGWQELR